MSLEPVPLFLIKNYAIFSSKVGRRRGRECELMENVVLVHARFNVKIQRFNSIPESDENGFDSLPHLFPTIVLLLFKLFQDFSSLDEIVTKPFKCYSKFLVQVKLSS